MACRCPAHSPAVVGARLVCGRHTTSGRGQRRVAETGAANTTTTSTLDGSDRHIPVCDAIGLYLSLWKTRWSDSGKIGDRRMHD
jgi:hypothetical protein